MKYSRRSTIKAGAFSLVGAWATPSVWVAAPDRSTGDKMRYEDFHKVLIEKAIDAAIALGASYADARISFTQSLLPRRSESIEFGVRALVQGYWGFSSGPVLSEEEAVRLGYISAELAKANSLGGERPVSLAPLDLESGSWSMPIKDDPFEMDLDEIADFEGGITSFLDRLKYVRSNSIRTRFMRQRKTFGSSQGQFTSQLLYRTSGSCGFTVVSDSDGTNKINVGLEQLTSAGLGFEYFRDRPLRGYIMEAHEEALRDLKLPIKPVDVGKYPVLINARGMASILSQTIGAATQIDRAMGYEANSTGTSYINDPSSMLNSLRIGNSLVNVLGSRSQEGSVGRVKWDDEGVQPADFTLVDQGVLVNMQTSREGVAWLGDVGRGESTGSMYTPTAIDVPLIHSADLTLLPGNDNGLDLDSLREGMDDGIELKSPHTTMDFQQITGYTRGSAYEIKKGKRIARLASAGMIFRTPELWGNITSVGNLESSSMFGLGSLKGEPGQISYHSVTTPAVLVKDMSVIDITRKA